MSPVPRDVVHAGTSPQTKQPQGQTRLLQEMGAGLKRAGRNPWPFPAGKPSSSRSYRTLPAAVPWVQPALAQGEGIKPLSCLYQQSRGGEAHHLAAEGRAEMQPSLAFQGRTKLLEGRCWRSLAGAAGPVPPLQRLAPGPQGQGEDGPVRASHQRGHPGLHNPDIPTAKRPVGGRQGGAGGWGGSPARRESWRPSLRPLGTSAATAFPSTELTFPPLFRWPPPALPPPRPPIAAGSPSHRTPRFGPAPGAGRDCPLAALRCVRLPSPGSTHLPFPPRPLLARVWGVKAEASSSPSVTWRKLLLQTSPTRTLLQSGSPPRLPTDL